jgi:hypothetical protein
MANRRLAARRIGEFTRRLPPSGARRTRIQFRTSRLGPRWLCLGCLLMTLDLQAQEAHRIELRTWADLQQDLSENQSLRVELRAGAVRLGRSVAVDDSTLSVRLWSGGETTRIRRGHIRELEVKTRSRTGTGALAGAAVGTAVGAIFVSDVFPSDSRNTGSDIAVGLITGAFAAGLGAIVGSQLAEYQKYSAD